ncbi:ATP-binding cassette domain-containing protein [Klebsiella pneumoniae]
MIAIDDLHKSYRTADGRLSAVLKGLSLQVPERSITAVVGPSGAGKSTLARCISLLEQPDSGSIRINGKDLSALSGEALRRERRAIGTVFQSSALLSRRTAWENVALPLATRAAHVVGVEGVPALVEKGRENAARNGLSNVTFFHENLEEDVTRQAWAKHGFDKVLLDPARAGAPGVMPHIIKLAPRRVVYVSCNPATLARDSETLLQAGYQIQRLAMLDMFPHTGHLESMVLFERRLT